MRQCAIQALGIWLVEWWICHSCQTSDTDSVTWISCNRCPFPWQQLETLTACSLRMTCEFDRTRDSLATISAYLSSCCYNFVFISWYNYLTLPTGWKLKSIKSVLVCLMGIKTFSGHRNSVVVAMRHHHHHHHLFVIKQVRAVTWTPMRVTGQQGTLTAAPSDVQ